MSPLNEYRTEIVWKRVFVVLGFIGIFCLNIGLIILGRWPHGETEILPFGFCLVASVCAFTLAWLMRRNAKRNYLRYKREK